MVANRHRAIRLTQKVQVAAPRAWKELANGVFALALEPFRANVGLVVGEERALLVDTGCSLEMAGEILELARPITDRP